MKKIVILCSMLISIATISCGDDEVCKNCSGCKTLAPATLCEGNFEKTSNFNDQVQNYESDGCICNKK